MKAFTTGPFTGKHFAAIIVTFFAVVVSVNVYMARAASSTFGGVVVENSYVASQNFNTWLAEAEKEKALGWTATVTRLGDNRLAVALGGAPAEGVELVVTARHPLGRAPDRELRFARQADGSFVSDKPLDAGRWRLRFDARAGEQRWRQEQDIR
ncbi:MAG: FixH family protein [Sphingomonadales bacterium]|nr:FixH family protein [Sphingomonadales bacterium]